MGVVFAGSELSAIKSYGYAMEAASQHDAARSRGSVTVNSSTAYFTIVAPAAITNGWIAFRGTISADVDGSDTILIVYAADGTPILRLYTPTDFNQRFQKWEGGAWVAVGNTYVQPGGAAYWGVRLKTGATATAELLRNGETVIPEVSIGTQPDFKWADLANPDNNDNTYYSEVVITDDLFPMTTYTVETEAPTADATDLDGTGTYADIDEAILDANVLTFTAAGQRRSFTSPARTATAAVVRGVGVGARMACGETGPQNARFYLKIGGTRYYSPTFALATGASAYQYVWETNPATAAAWTSTDANAATLEWGIEAVA